MCAVVFQLYIKGKVHLLEKVAHKLLPGARISLFMTDQQAPCTALGFLYLKIYFHFRHKPLWGKSISAFEKFRRLLNSDGKVPAHKVF